MSPRYCVRTEPTPYDPRKHLPFYDKDGEIVILCDEERPDEWEEVKVNGSPATSYYVRIVPANAKPEDKK